MEAALKDLQEWLQSLPVVEPKYYAEYDPLTGKILSVHPEYAALDVRNKIEIDNEIVESIIEGQTSLNSYIVDLNSSTVEFVEIQLLHKIDDVIHRIVDKKWSNVEDPDILITYFNKENILEFALSDKYRPGGRKIHWDGSTEMLFLVTDYNDPNIPIENISIKIDDIKVESKKIKLCLPNEFSIYTRRLFKNYIIEIK